MKYIYDIELNFNNKYYEFYEWEKKDNITHINKIPYYKITNRDKQLVDSYDSDVFLSPALAVMPF